MARGILWIVLMVCALLLVGCSSHPPSAAQFMNMKNKSFGFGSGGTLRTGDLYDGKCNNYDHNDYFCVEEARDLDLAFFYRIHYGVFGLSLENFTPNLHAGFLSRYVGLQGWAWTGMGAVEERYGRGGSFYGGVMLIEELPITEKFRIGASEHISRNVYKVDENLGGLSFWSADAFGEYGVGAYVSFWGASLEYRYGREIGKSNNRFYFTLNYLFGLKEKTPEEKQRRRELKSALNRYEVLRSELNVRKEKVKWLIRTKESQGSVTEEEIEEEKRQLQELRRAADQQKMKVRELKNAKRFDF